MITFFPLFGITYNCKHFTIRYYNNYAIFLMKTNSPGKYKEKEDFFLNNYEE